MRTALLTCSTLITIHLVASVGSAADLCEFALRGMASPNSVIGFNPDPKVRAKSARIVAASRIRTSPLITAGFNDTVENRHASNLGKVVRQETPFTVREMSQWISAETVDLAHFKELGFAIGDPHDGNLGTQATVFQGKGADHYSYTLIDLDETSVGILSLDFARYLIYLKATFGQLQNPFGPNFDDEIFNSYLKGLKQESMTPPEAVARVLSSTPEQVRQKVDAYARKRTDAEGKFKPGDFESGALFPFKTKFMESNFLQHFPFDRKVGDRVAFKSKLTANFESALRSRFPGTVRVLDVAIPVHDSGGSAGFQRFFISTEVQFEGRPYRLIVEFKENEPQSGWQNIVETPFKSAAERYADALQVSAPAPGPFLGVVDLKTTSFLMRPKGGQDVRAKGNNGTREQILFNAYTIGLFHGGQQKSVSAPYVNDVSGNFEEFKTMISGVTSKVLQRLSDTSGLRAPQKKNDKN